MTNWNDVTFRIDSLPPLATLESEWVALENAVTGSFFTSWHWIGTWLKTLPQEIAPHLVVAMRNGERIGLAVAVSRRERRHAIVDVRRLYLNATGDPSLDGITMEHNGFAGAAGLAPALVRWFACGDRGWNELVIPGHSGEGPDIPSLLREQYIQEAFANRALGQIALNGVGSVLSRNARQQLGRSMRELARSGPLLVEEAKDSLEALAFFDTLKDLHIRSWTRRGKRHAFAQPYFENFHRALIASAGSAVQLLRISAAGELLGVLYNFRYGSKAYAYQSGFADKGKGRPGYVCHALAMERCAHSGATEYDFLAGDNQLKRSFGTSPYRMCWLSFARPSPMLRLEHAARAGLRLFSN